MRSIGFVAVSLMLHGLLLFALITMPKHTVTPELGGEKLEIQMGEPADKPGVADAPATPEESKPQVVQQPIAPQPEVQSKPEPTPPPPPVAKVKTKPIPRIAHVIKSAPSTPAPSEAPVEPAVAETSEPLVPVKDSAPAGVEAAATESAEIEKPAPPAPAISEVAAVPSEGPPIAKIEKAAAPVSTAQSGETGELSKGGASKEGAVSYLDLRQLPGNKAPAYPNQARIENRQGQLELLYRVTKEGKVSDIQVSKSSGSKDLDNAAVKAIASYRFVPGQEGWARHPVTFSLKGQSETMPSRLRSGGKQAEAD